jgi:hypothetical protein
MNEKFQTIRRIIEDSKENETTLKVIMLQGVFNCLLLRKLANGHQIEEIEVKTLSNKNPNYEEGNIITINLRDNGLIKIEKL